MKEVIVVITVPEEIEDQDIMVGVKGGVSAIAAAHAVATGKNCPVDIEMIHADLTEIPEILH